MIYLASASPRRSELLKQVHIPFKVVSSSYEEENSSPLGPSDLVMAQALGKAKEALVKLEEEDVVLGADTIVVFDNKVLGKPKNEAEAEAMLRLLSGQVHEVMTGVAIVKGDVEDVFYVSTKVYFRVLKEEEIKAYIASKEPLDKAGAYGIQGKGALWVNKIEGSYTNVVGLPVETVYERLTLWEILHG